MPAESDRAVQSAVVAGVLLCVASGVVFRALAQHLDRDRGPAAIAGGTLQAVPMQFGACDDPQAPGSCWHGEALQLDAERVERLQTDDYIYRNYRAADGVSPVATMLVTCGGRPRDLQPHRPEVCYPAAGWTLREDQVAEVQTSRGVPLSGRLQQFVRGGLSIDRVAVFSYYIVDGAFLTDMSEVRSRVWKPDAAVGYMAMVQVVVSADRRPQVASELARSFAALSSGSIRQVLIDGAAAHQLENGVPIAGAGSAGAPR